MLKRPTSTRMRSELPRRWQLASEWEHLLSIAETGPVRSRWRVRPRSGQILAAQPAIEQLTEVLYSVETVQPRGVEMARRLVRDGAGPVYDPRSERSLADALDECLDVLAAGQTVRSSDAHARRRDHGRR